MLCCGKMLQINARCRGRRFSVFGKFDKAIAATCSMVIHQQAVLIYIMMTRKTKIDTQVIMHSIQLYYSVSCKNPLSLRVGAYRRPTEGLQNLNYAST